MHEDFFIFKERSSMDIMHEYEDTKFDCMNTPTSTITCQSNNDDDDDSDDDHIGGMRDDIFLINTPMSKDTSLRPNQQTKIPAVPQNFLKSLCFGNIPSPFSCCLPKSTTALTADSKDIRQFVDSRPKVPTVVRTMTTSPMTIATTMTSSTSEQSPSVSSSIVPASCNGLEKILEESYDSSDEVEFGSDAGIELDDRRRLWEMFVMPDGFDDDEDDNDEDDMLDVNVFLDAKETLDESGDGVFSDGGSSYVFFSDNKSIVEYSEEDSSPCWHTTRTKITLLAGEVLQDIASVIIEQLASLHHPNHSDEETLALTQQDSHRQNFSMSTNEPTSSDTGPHRPEEARCMDFPLLVGGDSITTDSKNPVDKDYHNKDESNTPVDEMELQQLPESVESSSSSYLNQQSSETAECIGVPTMDANATTTTTNSTNDNDVSEYGILEDYIQTTIC